MVETSLRENLRFLMESNNIDRLELAKNTGLQVNDIDKLLSGANNDPRISSLLPIAKYFRISIEEIMEVNLK